VNPYALLAVASVPVVFIAKWAYDKYQEAQPPKYQHVSGEDDPGGQDSGYIQSSGYIPPPPGVIEDDDEYEEVEDEDEDVAVAPSPPPQTRRRKKTVVKKGGGTSRAVTNRFAQAPEEMQEVWYKEEDVLPIGFEQFTDFAGHQFKKGPIGGTFNRTKEEAKGGNKPGGFSRG